MELSIVTGQQLDEELAEQIIEFDRANMQPVLTAAGLEFPEANRRRGLQSNPTFIIAMQGQAIAGYLEYLRSWRDPDYIYVGSIQIDSKHRHSSLLLKLLAAFRSLVAGEKFVGFETNVQKCNAPAVRLYQKIGFKLEPNPHNDASWTARAGRELLTESPIIPLIDKLHARTRK